MSDPTAPGGPADPGATDAAPGALRLIYEYEGDTVRLISQQRVDVAVPGFDLAEEAATDHVEVRSATGRALSRVRVRNALPDSHEVFGEPGESITRVADTDRRGAFTVIVPAPADAARVLLQRPRFVETDAGGPAPAPGAGAPRLRADSPLVLADDAIEG